jgi:hypothetical protein
VSSFSGFGAWFHNQTPLFIQRRLHLRGKQIGSSADDGGVNATSLLFDLLLGPCRDYPMKDAILLSAFKIPFEGAATEGTGQLRKYIQHV